MQVEILTAFDALEEVPAAQSVQAVTPPADQVPGEQETGAAATFGHLDPGGHREQVALEVAPTARENVPATQEKHVETEVAPRAAEYVPAPHGVHGVFAVVDHVPAPHWIRKSTKGTLVIEEVGELP